MFSGHAFGSERTRPLSKAVCLASSLPRSHAGLCYDPDLFLALTIVATAAVYAACLMHPQQIGPDEHEDGSRPTH
jgi:hypothetical protein